MKTKTKTTSIFKIIIIINNNNNVFIIICNAVLYIMCMIKFKRKILKKFWNFHILLILKSNLLLNENNFM